MYIEVYPVVYYYRGTIFENFFIRKNSVYSLHNLECYYTYQLTNDYKVLFL